MLGKVHVWDGGQFGVEKFALVVGCVVEGWVLFRTLTLHHLDARHVVLARALYVAATGAVVLSSLIF